MHKSQPVKVKNHFIRGNIKLVREMSKMLKTDTEEYARSRSADKQAKTTIKI
jgi:hypothetical protein